MAEKIISAKRDQRLWFLSDSVAHPFHLVDVIAWVVTGTGAPVPITPLGPFNGEYVLGTDVNWIARPSGAIFRDSSAVAAFLRSRNLRWTAQA